MTKIRLIALSAMTTLMLISVGCIPKIDEILINSPPDDVADEVIINDMQIEYSRRNEYISENPEFDIAKYPNSEWCGVICGFENEKKADVKLRISDHKAILTGCQEKSQEWMTLDDLPRSAFSIEYDYAINGNNIELLNPKWVYSDLDEADISLSDIDSIKATAFTYDPYLKENDELSSSPNPGLSGYVYSKSNDEIFTFHLNMITEVGQHKVPYWRNKNFITDEIRVCTYGFRRMSKYIDFVVSHFDVDGREHIRFLGLEDNGSGSLLVSSDAVKIDLRCSDRDNNNRLTWMLHEYILNNDKTAFILSSIDGEDPVQHE